MAKSATQSFSSARRNLLTAALACLALIGPARPSRAQEDIEGRIKRQLQLISNADGSVNLAAMKNAQTVRQQTLVTQSPASKRTQDASAGFQDLALYGPDNIGGRIRTIAVHPTIQNRMFIGSPGGGIWRSDDAGAHWAVVNSAYNFEVTHIVISPSNPAIMYAATGEFTGSAFPGGGIFKSTDSGANWAVLPSTVPQTYGDRWTWIGRIWVHPSNPSILLAGTSPGIYKSVDGGATWTQKNITNNNDYIYDIVNNPANPQQLLASGLFGTVNRTTDGGETWSAVNIDSPLRAVVAWSASQPNIVYASATSSASALGSVYKSTDSGQTFSIVSNPGQFISPQSQYDNCIWVDPTNSQKLVVGGVQILRSLDGGNTFALPGSIVHPDYHSITPSTNYNGSTNSTVFISSDGGIVSNSSLFNSTFTGPTGGWTNLSLGLNITQFYSVSSNGTEITGGTQDNGTLIRTPTAQDTANWTQFSGGDGADAPLSALPQYVSYAFSESQDLGGPFQRNPQGVVNLINAGLGESGTSPHFISPLKLDADGRLVAGARNLWILDNPLSIVAIWRILAPSASIGGDAAFIAVAPTNADVMWVVNSAPGNVRLYRSSNATMPVSTFVEGTLPVVSPVSAIHISNYDPNTGFVVFPGTSASGRIWKTIDGGLTWLDLTGNLPTTPVTDIAQSPWDPATLYVSTYSGLFVTGDGGASWLPTGGNYGRIINGLTWKGNELLFASFGSGVLAASLPYDMLSESIIPGNFSAITRTANSGTASTALATRLVVAIHGSVGVGIHTADGCTITSQSGGGTVPSDSSYECDFGNMPNGTIDKTWTFSLTQLSGFVNITSTVAAANPESYPPGNTASATINLGDQLP